MFDSETRWFIRCDTCPRSYENPAPWTAPRRADKDHAAHAARSWGWDISDGLHRCRRCVAKGRTERAL